MGREACSPRWREIERAHLAIHPVCAACLRGGCKVDVHHILPFHICIAIGRPDKLLDVVELERQLPARNDDSLS